MPTPQEKYPGYIILPGKSKNADGLTSTITVSDGGSPPNTFTAVVDEQGQVADDKASATNPRAGTAANRPATAIATTVNGVSGILVDGGTFISQAELDKQGQGTVVQGTSGAIYQWDGKALNPINPDNPDATRAIALGTQITQQEVDHQNNLQGERVNNQKLGKGSLTDAEVIAAANQTKGADAGVENSGSGRITANSGAAAAAANTQNQKDITANAVELRKIQQALVDIQKRKIDDDYTIQQRDADRADLLAQGTLAVQEGNRLAQTAATAVSQGTLDESIASRTSRDQQATDAAAAAITAADVASGRTSEESALDRGSRERIAAGTQRDAAQSDLTSRRGQDSALVGQGANATMGLIGQSLQFMAPTGTAQGLADSQNYMMDQNNWKGDAPKIQAKAQPFYFDPVKMGQDVMKGLYGTLASISPTAAQHLQTHVTGPEQQAAAAPVAPAVAPGAPPPDASVGTAQGEAAARGGGSDGTDDWYKKLRARLNADQNDQRFQAITVPFQGPGRTTNPLDPQWNGR
jgi:hypothetical protein